MYREMGFEEIIKKFIILLKPSPIVQDSIILNSRDAGLPTVPVAGILNNPPGPRVKESCPSCQKGLGR